MFLIDKDKSCTHKVRYGHRDTAEKVIDKLKAKNANIGRLESYECRYCKGWHIGHAQEGGFSIHISFWPKDLDDDF